MGSMKSYYNLRLITLTVVLLGNSYCIYSFFYLFPYLSILLCNVTHGLDKQPKDKDFLKSSLKFGSRSLLKLLCFQTEPRQGKSLRIYFPPQASTETLPLILLKKLLLFIWLVHQKNITHYLHFLNEK